MDPQQFDRTDRWEHRVCGVEDVEVVIQPADGSGPGTTRLLPYCPFGDNRDDTVLVDYAFTGRRLISARWECPACGRQHDDDVEALVLDAM